MLSVVWRVDRSAPINLFMPFQESQRSQQRLFFCLKLSRAVQFRRRRDSITIYSVGKWAAIIQRFTHQYIDKRFNHFGLGNTEGLVLLTLYEQGNVSQEYITRQIVMDKATVTRAIKRLEKKVSLPKRQRFRSERKDPFSYWCGLENRKRSRGNNAGMDRNYDKRVYKGRKRKTSEAYGKSSGERLNRSRRQVEYL
ncbi:hypothetical protein CHL76_06670 [Marinococcus halophilus]|uniref:MarR family winged helix-turn-helix transcriptional regulator n=2 Tax=Marinococcus halophilus TaxID=1371 RepID=UPI000BA059EE|nr:MarR family transcriptional regulator [Marinococcus halophilus]OZT80606.1 hypothetical protein CHL76_06670 [Marinococcus halophilus]